MATVTEKLKESLVGTDEVEPQLSASTRDAFMTHALKDEETGEHYMGRNEFINAIAPEGEDYVRIISFISLYNLPCTCPAPSTQHAPAYRFLA